MPKKILFSLLALSSLVAEEPDCDITVSPERITARHVESQGIGYNLGYSTIEGFFTHPEWVSGSFVPFLDLRAHVFNSGKPAANAGVGLRYLDKMVWGINAYYDYRKTEHQNYNQISVGFEALGEVWDFRLNGYFPVGRTHSHLYQPKFYAFSQNQMIISLWKEFAMTGTNAEAGYHFTAGSHVDLYAAAGPYYFGAQGKHAGGGQGRLYGTIWNYLSLEIKASYDSLFKGIVQGELGIIIPFSQKKNVKKREGMDCTRERALRKRAYQRVDRQEIIPVDRKRKQSLAINPATNQPWFFLFVDNTSHSLGTYESPFPTLVQAETASSPGDIIYIFPGDGTSTGMNTGVTLQNDQKLFGSGTVQMLITTQGTVAIPPQSSSSPLLTNTTSPGNIVTLASGNEISGLNLVASVSGATLIYSAGGASGVSIHDNMFSGAVNFGGVDITGNGLISILNNQMTTTAASPGQAIRLTTDPNALITGSTSGNVISNFGDCIGMNLNNGGMANYEISGNTVYNNTNGGLGIFWGGFAGTSGPSTGSILNNQLIEISASGIQIYSDGDSQCLTIDGNRIVKQTGNTADGILIQTVSSSFAPTNVSVTNNTISNPGTGHFGVNASTTGSSTICLRLQNNTVTNGAGYSLANPSGTFNFEPAQNNVGSFTTSGTITNVSKHTCSCSP